MPQNDIHGHVAGTIHALIVDDEAPGRLNLRYVLAQHARWQVVAECAGTREARAALDAHRVDVVFLDIRMPNESGLVLARTLCDRTDPPLVVFVTAFDAHAVEAFDVHALDYLLKPFDNARLAQTLARAEQLLTLRRRDVYAQAMRSYFDAEQRRERGHPAPAWTHVTVRSLGSIERIAMEDVLWIASAGNYVELHLEGRTVLHRVPIGRLEQHLASGSFVRTHRSAIVRADQCVRLAVAGDGSYRLTLRCGAEVPVSERHVDNVRSALDREPQKR